MTDGALTPEAPRIQCLATEGGERPHDQSPGYETDAFIKVLAEIAVSVARRQEENLEP